MNFHLPSHASSPPTPASQPLSLSLDAFCLVLIPIVLVPSYSSHSRLKRTELGGLPLEEKGKD
jgi:hypothetical protein